MRTAVDPRIDSAPSGAQRLLAAAGGTVLVAGTLALGSSGWRPGALFLIGALLGMALYHGAFGFTAAYRRAILERDVSGAIAQLVMLGLAMLLFAPILASGAASGAVAPASLQVALGSFIFGLGMQLGGGCGSGTLYTVGGGNARMVITLVAFCAGAFAGSLDMARYAGLPSLGTVSFAETLGWPGAILFQFALLGALWMALKRYAGDAPQRPLWPGMSRGRLLAGPWPLLFSAVLLAVLNWLTLLVAGHPWTVTWAFTLWGAKAAALLGWDPASAPFWTAGFTSNALGRSIFEDNISIMDMGIMVGAMSAAALAGRFSPRLRIPPLSLLAAVLGGLLMGYGARLAFGCNIGAFFSGVASFSLHGWLWIVCALAGTWIGVPLRPLFGLRD